MSTEAISVSGPIEVKSNSPERVAYELMKLIAIEENAGDQDKSKREYWLTLYRQCLKATSGYILENILKKE